MRKKDKWYSLSKLTAIGLDMISFNFQVTDSNNKHDAVIIKQNQVKSILHAALNLAMSDEGSAAKNAENLSKVVRIVNPSLPSEGKVDIEKLELDSGKVFELPSKDGAYIIDKAYSGGWAVAPYADGTFEDKAEGLAFLINNPNSPLNLCVKVQYTDYWESILVRFDSERKVYILEGLGMGEVSGECDSLDKVFEEAERCLNETLGETGKVRPLILPKK